MTFATKLWAGAGVAVLVVLLLAVMPWVVFWAIGVLFDHSIPYTFKTWLAATALLLIVGGSSRGRTT